jgi:hypothetical protein
MDALVEIFGFIEERSTPVTELNSTELQRRCINRIFSSTPFYLTARIRLVEKMIAMTSDEEVIAYARAEISRLADSGWAEPPFE